MKKLTYIILLILFAACTPQTGIPVTGASPTLITKATKTLTPVSQSPTLTTTLAVTETHEHPPTSAPIPTDTQVNTPDTQPDFVEPYPSAPLCEDTGENHDNSLFHLLWDGERGCHYDHEHGSNPFTPDVANAFPGFNLRELLGGVEIGHTNPSSQMENTHKHGGFKWFVMLDNPHGCVAGFEGAQWCVKSAVIQYHTFGDYAMEMESRKHSVAYLLKICNPSNPSDCGILYMVNLEDYGQRVTPYQNTVIPYPDTPLPDYGSGFGPYNTIDCIYTALPGCRASVSQILSLNLNTVSKWTSKLTGTGTRPSGNRIADLLFDVRDTYQLFDSRDLVYPFTFAWVCTSDNGVTYNPIGCKHNNSATDIHEIGGVVPAAWDNLTGFDTNPATGRITAEGFVDDFGNIDPSCSVAGGNCYPIKLENMFVGKYGDYTSPVKLSQITAANTPSRNIFWCNGVMCSETGPGAVPSGWIGASN